MCDHSAHNNLPISIFPLQLLRISSLHLKFFLKLSLLFLFFLVSSLFLLLKCLQMLVEASLCYIWFCYRWHYCWSLFFLFCFGCNRVFFCQRIYLFSRGIVLGRHCFDMLLSPSTVLLFWFDCFVWRTFFKEICIELKFLVINDFPLWCFLNFLKRFEFLSALIFLLLGNILLLFQQSLVMVISWIASFHESFNFVCTEGVFDHLF